VGGGWAGGEKAEEKVREGGEGGEGRRFMKAGASGRASEREEKKNPEETSEHNTSDDNSYSVPHLAFPLLLCPGFLRSCGNKDHDQSSRCPQNSPPEINFTLIRRAHAVEIAFSRCISSPASSEALYQPDQPFLHPESMYHRSRDHGTHERITAD